jgi:uncharacterized protein
MYQQGRGVRVDYAEAMNWYRRAADGGNDSAMYNIGLLFDEGLGMDKNKTQAVFWYRKAADAGNVLAKTSLKNLGVKD